MPIVSCKICERKFYTKPNLIEKGWGKYCSPDCKFKAQLRGKFVYCDKCNKKIWRSPAQLKDSVSGKFFCTKSCQTFWRNKFYSGSKHPLWTGGKKRYRVNLLSVKNIPVKCVRCGYDNESVLVVHHKDGDRKNVDLCNLEWLCRNCHYLSHNRETV